MPGDVREALEHQRALQRGRDLRLPQGAPRVLVAQAAGDEGSSLRPPGRSSAGSCPGRSRRTLERGVGRVGVAPEADAAATLAFGSPPSGWSCQVSGRTHTSHRSSGPVTRTTIAPAASSAVLGEAVVDLDQLTRHQPGGDAAEPRRPTRSGPRRGGHAPPAGSRAPGDDRSARGLDDAEQEVGGLDEHLVGVRRVCWLERFDDPIEVLEVADARRRASSASRSTAIQHRGEWGGPRSTALPERSGRPVAARAAGDR